jgi:hypothetical protein
VERKYGLPFRGYVSSRPRNQVPSDSLSVGSVDWMVDPNAGSLVRRSGSEIVGDTIAAQVGILPAKWGATARQVVPVVSSSIQDGYPTHGVLFGNEASALGQFAIFSTNAVDGGHRTPMDRYALTGHLQSLPIRTTATGTSINRGVTALDCRALAAGSRGTVAHHTGRYFPSYLSTPHRWSETFSDSGSGGATRLEEMRQWGHRPPLLALCTPYPSGGASSPWQTGMKFYYSVVFRFSDGSYSMPLIPRAPNAINANGYLLCSVTYSSEKISWWLPIGPAECDARILLRSPLVDTSSNPELYPDPSNMLVVAIVENNSQTIYSDMESNDSALAIAPDLIRFDHVLPERSRYCWKFDQRYAIGYLKPNPTAIFLSPVNVTMAAEPHPTYDFNRLDAVVDSVISYGITMSVAVRDNQVAATRVAKQLIIALDGTEASVPIALTSTASLWDVVDTINTSIPTTLTAAVGMWRAQLAPGANGMCSSDNIELTQVYANFTGSGNTLTIAAGGDTAAGSLANVKIGMLLGTIPGVIQNSTYVTNVGATTVTLSRTVTTFAAATAVVIGWFTGNYPPGTVRCTTTNYCAALYFTEAYLASFKPRKDHLRFTGGSPGHPPNAINNFYVGNQRSAPDSAGELMGGGALLAGSVVCFSRSIYLLRNIKTNTTGMDEDYRLVPLSVGRGCVSPYSIVEGHGWVGYMTPDGYAVTDGQNEVIISHDIWNPAQRTGDLAYEMDKCVAESACDGEDFGFHAVVADGKLYLTYRASATVRRQIVYNYSTQVTASGLDQVLQGGRPFGWSSPSTLQFSAMGVVRKSDGLRYYGCVEGNSGSTGDGRVDRFEYGTLDNGNRVSPVGYCGFDLCETVRKKSVQKMWVFYFKRASGLVVRLARNWSRSGFQSMSLPGVAGVGVDMGRAVLEMPLVSRSPRDGVEVSFYDDGSGSSPVVYGVSALVDQLSSEL